MAQVTIEVNSKSYAVGCEDGQESRLKSLAVLLDEQVKQVGGQVGPLGETRLILMGALLLADELVDARARLRAHSSEVETVREEAARIEARAATAIHTLAARLESIAQADGPAAPSF